MQYLSNAALARTSVASTTVLSSTSGLFTLFIGVLLGQDSINAAKIIAVFISMAGVVMTTQAANGLVSNQFWWFRFSFGLTGFSGKWFEQHTGVVWFSSTTKIIWIGVVWFIFGLTLAD